MFVKTDISINSNKKTNEFAKTNGSNEKLPIFLIEPVKQ